MRIMKIPNIKKPLAPIKQKKNDLLLKCHEVRHKKVKDISVKEIPYLGALMGLFTPIPFGFLVGFGFGKLIEYGVKLFKKK